MRRGRASGEAAPGKLFSEWLVECEPPLAGEPDGDSGCHGLRDARHAEGVVCPESAALTKGYVSGGAAPHDAGARRLDARQRTGRAGRDLCVDCILEAG